ncbi:nuclear transport factor 2 family protein [Tamlana flava]|uniref:nuclear transport factor 2 family protein n=1 Tax=Tamlana flava TaxID=3158572 RepID=UPI00351B36ED
MKKIMKSFYLFAVLLLFHNSHLFAQTQNDSLQIRETVLNYIEGMETNDPKRIEKAMHPDLAKRTIAKNKEGIEYPANMTAASLIGYAKDFDYTLFYIGDEDPKEPLRADVTIYDISNGIASVKAATNKFEFVDYIHLGKLDGEWKIINILWAWTGSTNKWMNRK